MIARVVCLGVTALLALGACAGPRPFTEEFLEPLRVRRVAVPATPVAVFAFADERREEDPAVVVRYEPLDGRARVERATVPVGLGVGSAFARGLAARGYTVTDATAQTFPPADRIAAPLAVTGRVAEFGVRIARRGMVSGWETRAGVRLTVEVWNASGQRVFERAYQRATEGAMMLGGSGRFRVAPCGCSTDASSALAQALADVVEHAVIDPDLAAALR